jgi:death on curing protein
MLALTLNTVKNLHEVVIKHGAEKGIKSEGMLIACIDKPFTNFYKRNPFPTIFDKAYALLYSIAGPFHPFIDGNKRTAFLVISYFLRVNGYEFNYPNNSYEFINSIARNENIKMDTASL